jgi:hypothetical protein
MVGTVVGGYGAAQLKARPSPYPHRMAQLCNRVLAIGPLGRPQGVVARTGFRLMDPCLR